MTTIILTRHGETNWNTSKKLQGNTDIPLSENGIKQAELLANRLETFGITKIYTSKLIRAIQTGKAVAKKLGLKIQEVEGLNERSYGEHEGRTWNEIKHHYDYKNKQNSNYKPLNGESRLEFRERTVNALKEIIEDNENETILIVCHGGVLHILTRFLRSIPDEEETDFRFPNTCISVYKIDEEVISEKIFADASHLPQN